MGHVAVEILTGMAAYLAVYDVSWLWLLIVCSEFRRFLLGGCSIPLAFLGAKSLSLELLGCLRY